MSDFLSDSAGQDFTATMKAILRILSGLPEKIDTLVLAPERSNTIQMANDHLDGIARTMLFAMTEVTRLKERLDGAQQAMDLLTSGKASR